MIMADGRILIADDEPSVRDAVGYALEQEGFDVTLAEDGDDADRKIGPETPNFDLLILDIMMPGRSGLDICRDVRARSPVPIILLTAKDAEVDKVVGLEVGADDYVTKPFSVRELLGRVRAQLRRRELDRTSEFQVLRLLAERPGQVFSRLEIMEELWQSEFSGDVRACDVHISNLRQKIERDPQEPELVLTVRGVGYRLAEGGS
jgi:DNA-binding response OmpR family regulator